MSAEFLQAIAAAVGSDALITGQATRPYCEDKRGRYFGNALAVVFPSNADQVSEIVRLCIARNVSVVPQGGNTSLCGASVPLPMGDQIVVNLSRMNRIIAVDPVDYTMTVEAGCKLATLYEAAEKADRLFPLGLTAIAPHCEIGGNLSTNAGGINVLRYGNARDLVLGLEVVLPDGRIWNGLRGLRKDNTGYDLKHLFVGAEGTLGIITKAVLKLYSKPKSSLTACVAIESPQAAVNLLAHMRSCCALSGFEIMSRNCLELVFKHVVGTREPFEKPYAWYLLIRADDVAKSEVSEALQKSDVIESLVSDDPEQTEQWWRLRKNISDAQKSEGISIKHDVSVPVSRIAEFIEQASRDLHSRFPGIRIVAFGHMGDGNIHYNASMPDASNLAFIEGHESEVNRIVYEVVRGLNGSISAEHGLGQLKRNTIRDYKDPLELELMRRIKDTFDPLGLMNPGKVI